MDEILTKASELGKMIKETVLYKEYEKTLETVEKDPESSELMAQYNDMVLSMQKRMDAGDIIESYEKEALRDLSSEIENNSVLTDFLKIQKRLTEFLGEIQEKVMSQENNI